MNKHRDIIDAGINAGNEPLGVEADIHPEIWKRFEPTQIICGKDSSKELELYSSLYYSIAQAVPTANAAYRECSLIDTDVPPQKRKDRQTKILSDAVKSLDEKMLEPLANFEMGLHQKMIRLRESLQEAPKSEIGSLKHEMKAIEIRRMVSGLKPSEQTALLFKAADRGNLSFLDAIQDSPIRVLPQDIQDRAQDIYNDKHCPTLGQMTAEHDKIMSQARAKTSVLQRALLQTVRVGGVIMPPTAQV